MYVGSAETTNNPILNRGFITLRFPPPNLFPASEAWQNIQNLCHPNPTSLFVTPYVGLFNVLSF